MTHTPTINHNTSQCSCRGWPGVCRSPEEAQGHFTKRAYEAFLYHVAHAREPAPQQSELFSFKIPCHATTPDQPQITLFFGEGNEI